MTKKFITPGLIHSCTDETPKRDSVSIIADSKDQVEDIMSYLSFCWAHRWKFKYKELVGKEIDLYDDRLLDRVHRDLFKLPEGYHLEIRLVKND